MVTIGKTHTEKEVKINIINDLMSRFNNKQIDEFYKLALDFNRTKNTILEEKVIKYKSRYESFWDEIE